MNCTRRLSQADDERATQYAELQTPVEEIESRLNPIATLGVFVGACLFGAACWWALAWWVRK